MAARLLVELLGDSTSAVAAMGQTKTAAGEATGAAQKTGVSLSSVAKAVATGYAVTKIVEFGKSTVQVTGDAIQANHRLEQTFKNAGDATGSLAQHAEALAESLGRATGVSPTVIKNAESILTTFHAVSSQTAVTAGIFDRATAAAGDLAAAGFGDMGSNAKLLGKALQDPTQGMGALRRAGVNLSSAQQDQIKNMQKSGDLLGAQKTLLGEVEGQVKGTAEATAGAGAKQKVAYEQMQVAIGTALMPAIKAFRGELTGLFNFVSANASWLVPLIVAVTGFAVAVLIVSKAISTFTAVIGAVKGIISGVRTAWMLLNLAFAASPIGVIIIAIVAVVAILVLLYVKVDWFRAFVNTAMRDIVNFFQVGWNAVVGVFQFVWSWIQANWPLLVGALFGPFGLAIALIVTNWSTVVSFLSGVWNAIVAGVSVIAGAIAAPFIAAWQWIWANAIAPLIGAFNALGGWISGALSVVTSVIVAPFAAAWGWLAGAIGGVLGWFGGLPGAIGGALGAVTGAIIAPFSAAWGWLWGFVGGIAGAFAGVPGAIAGALGGVFNAIIGPFKAAWDWISSNVLGPIKSGWNAIANAINGIHLSVEIPSNPVTDFLHISGKGFDWSPPFHIPTLQAGGLVTRTGLILAHAGEAVTPLPARAGRGGPLVEISGTLNFSERIDVESFGRRLAWMIDTEGV